MQPLDETNLPSERYKEQPFTSFSTYDDVSDPSYETHQINPDALKYDTLKPELYSHIYYDEQYSTTTEESVLFSQTKTADTILPTHLPRIHHHKHQRKHGSSIWQVHAYLECTDKCDHKYNKIKKWTEELVNEKEFAQSKYHYRVRKLSATHCGCPSIKGIAIELYLNRTHQKSSSGSKPCVCYTGDPNNKIEFWNFVRRHHSLPQEFAYSKEFERLLDGQTSSMVIFYNKRCETEDYFKIMQNFSAPKNLSIYKQRFPLMLDVKVEVEKRLDPPADECQLLIINSGQYIWLPVNTNKSLIIQHLESTKPDSKIKWKKIKEKLTDVEKTFYMGQALSEDQIWKPACILVGTTGGVAVIALAVSIFWGLNGSTFASK
uniref:SCP domain-containing protein n=1 Tax=Syphacia muris TaxID=451379 RepID=A0A0N5ALI5_9BILA